MGSGSTKSTPSTVVAPAIAPDPSGRKLKGILKPDRRNRTIRETVEFSRKDIAPPVPPRPPPPKVNRNSADIDTKSESGAGAGTIDDKDGVYMKVGDLADKAEIFETVAEQFRPDSDDEPDRISEGSSIDLETLRALEPDDSTEEGLARLEKLHHNGTYTETEYTEARFKVFNDYLVWATETGSRGERVVIPDENMKIQQKQLIRDTMKRLGEADSYTGNEELHCLLVLCKMSDVRQKDYVELVTELGFAKLFMRIWNNLHTVDVKDQIANPAAYLAINMLLDTTQGYTEISDVLCREMGEHCVPALLDVLDDVFYDVNALNKDSKKLRWMSRREFLKRILTVLYHCIRHHMDNKTIFRECHASILLKPYLKCRFLILRVKAIFTLAFIVTEDENAQLNTTNTNIDFIVKILSKAMNEPNHYSAHYNFSAIQVADAMKFMAANDDNKVKFVRAGALALLIAMMKTNNMAEQRSAAEALWMLSFNHNNKDAILGEPDCVKTVRKLMNEGALNRQCEAILWNVGEETHATLTKKKLNTAGRKPKPVDNGSSPSTSPALTPAASVGNSNIYDTIDKDDDGDIDASNYYDEEEISTNHVMLSYQWDVQKQIMKVKELLQAEGYKVWMDVDHMGGSTLEAMASAVENAAVVLICFSEKYKDSPACRTEAEYTFKLNKPIVPLKMQADYQADGWLGIMLGTKFYIEMSTMDQVVDNVDRLKRELAGRGRISNNGLIARHPSTSVSSGKPDIKQGGRQASRFRRDDSKRLSRREAAKDVTNWTNDDVNSWLLRNGLTELKNRLQGYDGEGIMGLKTIASDAPEFFYREVKTELGLKSLREIIRFKQALDDIL